MINLQDFENYFTSLAKRTGCKSVFFLTSETDIQKKIKDITPEQQPIMMMIIPSANTKGSTQDGVEETNTALLYVLNKDDRAEYGTFNIQKDLQPIFEQVKQTMIADKENCGLMRGLDVGSLSSDPESKLISQLTGWSLQFDIVSE